MRDFRRLRFQSIGELLEEIDRVEQAAAEGRLKTTGNWTAGEILNHIAAWAEYGYEGFPMKPLPRFIQWFFAWRLKKQLRSGAMPRGVRIPGVPGGTFGVDSGEIRPAAERVRVVMKRLEANEPCPHPSPAFGPMSHADRIALNLQHAALHLGHLRYDQATAN